MSVTECRYSRDSPPSSSLDERGRATHTVSYRVTTDEDMAPPDVANNCQDVTGSDNEAGAVGGDDDIVVPQLWDSYAYLTWTDPTSFLREIVVQPLEFKNHKWHWQVDTTYRPLAPGETPQHANKDGLGNAILPQDRPARVWIENEVYTTLVEKDVVTGKPIVNTAGQPFDSDIEEPAARSVLVAMKSVQTLLDVSDYTKHFQYSINNAKVPSVIGDFDGGELLCRSVTSTPIITEGSNTYYDMTFRFAISEEGWDRELLSRGYKHYVDLPGGGAKLVNATEPVTDENGELTEPITLQQVSEPVLLDANGYKLAEGGTPVFSKFTTIKARDYTHEPFSSTA